MESTFEGKEQSKLLIYNSFLQKLKLSQRKTEACTLLVFLFFLAQQNIFLSLFLFLFFYLVLQLRSYPKKFQPQIILSKEGLFVRSLGLPTLKWSEIRDAKLIKSQTCLQLILNHPESFGAKPPFDFSFRICNLTLSSDKIYTYINEHLHQHVDSKSWQTLAQFLFHSTPLPKKYSSLVFYFKFAVLSFF